MRIGFAAHPILFVTLTACTATFPDEPDQDEVRAGTRLAARYVHADYDPSDVRRTCKVWHEVHAPDGRLLTKGLGGQFEHHRGLFLGFHRTIDGERVLDFWHCNHGESQRHRGHVDARRLSLPPTFQCVAVDWCDADGAVVVEELRALRAREIEEDAICLDVVVELASPRVVRLTGDPQHSGHQFRALDRFAAEGSPEVRYVRPAGMLAQKDDVWTGGTWIAAVLPFPDGEGGPVTVIRIETDGNPTPVRWSTRGYGRFGATFEYGLAPGAPLRLSYHYLVVLGAQDAAQCERLARRALA